MASITTSAKSMVAYTQSDAIMWKLDPRAKLLWVCVTIALCVMFRSPIPVAAVCLQTFVISQMWGFPVFTQIKQHKGVFIFLVVFVGLLNLLFTGYVGGETLVSLNLGLFHITLTDKGAVEGGLSWLVGATIDFSFARTLCSRTLTVPSGVTTSGSLERSGRHATQPRFTST